MADKQSNPSLFSAPAPTDPTGMMSAAAGFNMGGMSPLGGAGGGGMGGLVGRPSAFSGGGGVAVPGMSTSTGALAQGNGPAISLPSIRFPNMQNVLAGLNPRGATDTSGLPAPMDMSKVDAALAGMKVPNANLPAPIDANKIFAQGNMIGPQDTANLAKAIYSGGETLVAPQREQQMTGLREQLAQAGILNSPSGLALERVLQQDTMQQDNLLAAKATETATEVQLSREQLRTNVAAQVALQNQQQQFQGAMQTQQLQAEMAAQKAGLNIEALSTRFNQQLAVSTLAIQKFFEFGNLMLGAASLASSGATAAANYALGKANIGVTAAGLALQQRQYNEQRLAEMEAQQRAAWAARSAPTPSRFTGSIFGDTTGNFGNFLMPTEAGRY